MQKALELLWTSKFLNADEAKDIGLVCDVFDDDKMLDEEPSVIDMESYMIKLMKRDMFL